MQLEKTYNPQEIEQHWYKLWEEKGFFVPSGAGNPYCIMIPPPNVTGTLHMGHAFQYSLMDILTRYHRMQGDNTLWQPGTDHAGIATQMVVERQLAKDNLSRHDLGREAFVEKVWQWKEESGNTITNQTRKMGASVDWTRERFTLDEGLSHAVKTVFVKLYRENLIYRGKRLVNWDPVLHTALSDLEVISEEENGNLWHMRYPLADGSGHIVVATTRPETMLGDTAVAVHPEDERYQHMIGKMIALPLCDRNIPIIADEYVDKEFGSGCVKITPAHDFNDYEVGQRHDLPLINIFTPDAKINEDAPEQYQGLERYVARKQIVKDLKALDLMEEIKPHRLMVPRGDRSGTVVEPYLTDQWYVKIQPLAEPAIEAVKEGRIRFVPDKWDKTYFNWMEDIQDWCISRQLWWGHRIPAWYDENHNIYVGFDEQEVRQHYHLDENIALTQDTDVLDTWFSSALWPFSTLGWPEHTDALKTWYPTNVLVTGFDIIFFWVARMIMFGLKFAGDVPFKEVYVHGLVRDSEGQKMSKTKGNVLDPLDLINGIDLEPLVTKRTRSLVRQEDAPKIEKATRKEFPKGLPAFGADALRFTFASQATMGRDVRFDIQRIEGYRNFCNKLWNASRYVLMQVENQEVGLDESLEVALSMPDRWIISRLQNIESEVKQHIETYRFDLAAHALYEFTWNEYCDWYLEYSKPLLQEDNKACQRGTRKTLVRVLEAILRLNHPFIPFITEELWQIIGPLAGKTGDTICLQAYPQADENKIDHEALTEGKWLQAVISAIRSIRSEMNIKPSIQVPIVINNGSEQEKIYLDKYKNLLMTLAKVETVTWLEKGESYPESATALIGELQVLIPLADLIDKEEETKRLQKEITKREKDLEKINVKLGNPNFADKAPAHLVEEEKARKQDLEQAITQLKEQIEKILKL